MERGVGGKLKTVEEILTLAVEQGVTDIFIIAGGPVAFKLHGKIMPQDGEIIYPDMSRELISHIYDVAKRDMKTVDSGDDDFAFSLPGLSRFRASVYKQRGSLAAVIRIISFGIPDYRGLSIPEGVINSADKASGLILVTGPAGSGKSTTLACMINHINEERSGHIITLEDPIEYLHRNNKCIVSQREVSLDTSSYVSALRACLRQAPDVILVGEMRDFETIQTVMTAAETGHLVISTLHTVGAADTVDRIIDVFPPAQQQQVRIQLSMLLQGVISQQLIPTLSGGLKPAFEVMYNNTAIRTLIRESKIHQIDSAIASGAAEGMVAMDASLLALRKAGEIDDDTALHYATNGELMQRRLAAGR
ncbi:MAG: PilT/PilU family type 4a pilus ATPase [Oscillospiraceae bacterium]|jgi:twitching motility protein PilT|nr:PilT/PilU family type 4a pilus ATPase [Oscillospiraceae bacterium]